MLTFLYIAFAILLASGWCEEEFCPIDSVESCEWNNADGRRSSIYAIGTVCLRPDDLQREIDCLLYPSAF